MRDRIGEAAADEIRPRREETVGHPRDRVLFLEDHRHAQETRSRETCSRGIPADADHRHGFEFEQHPHRLEHRPRQQRDRPRRLRRASGLDPLEIDQGQGQITLGNQLGFETPPCAEPVDLGAEGLQFGSHRETGEDVAPGASARNHHSSAHTLASRDRLSSRPTEARVTTRSVLP